MGKIYGYPRDLVLTKGVATLIEEGSSETTSAENCIINIWLK